MGWVYLAAAIGFEIAGTISLKLSAGFTRLAPAIAVVVFYGVCFSALGLALKTVPVSVAYAVWSAVGIAVLAAVGMIWFREPVSALKLAALAVIVAGVVMLYIADRLAEA
jgi:small multidrug resistance pump